MSDADRLQARIDRAIAVEATMHHGSTASERIHQMLWILAGNDDPAAATPPCTDARRTIVVAQGGAAVRAQKELEASVRAFTPTPSPAQMQGRIPGECLDTATDYDAAVSEP